jgi:adenine-specific DNA-methyltransferase
MAISASLLAENGVMVTITPRSFATGDYFSRCRRHVFSRVVPEAVHLFRSRKLAFKSDAVLQENVILRARKTKPKPTAMVDVSASDGPEDIQQRNSRPVKLGSVLEISSPRAIFHIPVDGLDDALVRFVRGWPKTLHTLGLEVSTGPVVAFRARRFLTSDFTGHAQGAPLLWLQNIRQMTIDWPLTRLKKPQSIVDSKDSRGILIQNKNYVVLRRFTTKEEPRRLIAAPLIRETLPGRMIGLENHLNYVHRPHGEVGEEEAVGLAAVLGSSLLDQYFRISNGNTQVNAAELRCLPLPARETLVLLGREVRPRLGLPGNLDFVIDDILGVPDKLRRTSKAG